MTCIFYRLHLPYNTLSLIKKRVIMPTFDEKYSEGFKAGVEYLSVEVTCELVLLKS